MDFGQPWALFFQFECCLEQCVHLLRVVAVAHTLRVAPHVYISGFFHPHNLCLIVFFSCQTILLVQSVFRVVSTSRSNRQLQRHIRVVRLFKRVDGVRGQHGELGLSFCSPLIRGIVFLGVLQVAVGHHLRRPSSFVPVFFGKAFVCK